MNPEQPVDFVLKLDSDRRREIDEVKTRMEGFLREQINVTNELKIVSEGQKNLKERFEMGVAKTLTGLDKKFDNFMIEWGKKQAEDTARDKAIAANEKIGKDNSEDMRKYMLWPTISLCLSLILLAVAWLVKKGP